MVRPTDRPNGLPGPFLIAAALTLLPACGASAGHLRGGACPPGSAPSGNVAYRPVYPVPGTKPLYLSNYAGATYPPLRDRAPAVIDPAAVPTSARRPLGWWPRRGHAAR